MTRSFSSVSLKSVALFAFGILFGAVGLWQWQMGNNGVLEAQISNHTFSQCMSTFMQQLNSCLGMRGGTGGGGVGTPSIGSNFVPPTTPGTVPSAPASPPGTTGDLGGTHPINGTPPMNSMGDGGASGGGAQCDGSQTSFGQTGSVHVDVQRSDNTVSFNGTALVKGRQLPINGSATVSANTVTATVTVPGLGTLTLGNLNATGQPPTVTGRVKGANATFSLTCRGS